MRESHGKNWAQHIHRPYHWVCPLQQDLCLFNVERDGGDKQALLSHMIKEHSKNYSIADLSDLASTSKVSEPLDARICPFCGLEAAPATRTTVETSIDQTESMTDHISEHLASIALWSSKSWQEGPTFASRQGDGQELPDDSTRKIGPHSVDGHPIPVGDKGPESHEETHEGMPSASDDSRLDPGIILGEASSPHQAAEHETVAPDAVQRSESDLAVSSETEYSWDHDLENRLAESFVMSRFPEGRHRIFVPHGVVDELITAKSVAKSFFEDADGLETLADHQYRESELIEFVLKSAKKVFTISLFCYFTGKRLKTVMETFRRHSFDDTRLPIRSHRDLDSVTDARLWSRLKQETFKATQWRLLAPVFPSTFTRMYLLPETILPFTDVAEQREEGRFGSVYKVSVHPSHQVEPMRKVRQCTCLCFYSERQHISE